jgi:hypothetical protein
VIAFALDVVQKLLPGHAGAIPQDFFVLDLPGRPGDPRKHAADREAVGSQRQIQSMEKILQRQAVSLLKRPVQ